MESYCDRYSKTIYDVSVTSGPVPKFEGPVMKDVAKQLFEKVPMEKLQDRRAWRDTCLTKLSILKKEMNSWTILHVKWDIVNIMSYFIHLNSMLSQMKK